MKKLDILAAIITVFAWGSNYVAVSYTVSELPGFLSIAIRLFVTAVLLLPFAPKPNLKFKDLYLLSLIFGVFYLGLLYYGLYLGLNTSLTIIIMQLNIPLSVIIARISLKEKFTLSSIIGVLLAFIGTIIVVGTPHISGNIFALSVILCSAFSCAIFNVQSRRFREVPPLSIVCWTGLIASPHLFLISYFIEGNPIYFIKNASHIAWLGSLYSITIASFLCQGLWVYLLQKYPLYKVLPYNLLVPFTGVSLSVIYLGDTPSWHIVMGGAITICGIAISQAKSLPIFRNKKL